MTNSEFLAWLHVQYRGKLPVQLKAREGNKVRYIEIHGGTDCVVFGSPPIVRPAIERLDLDAPADLAAFNSRFKIPELG